MKYILSSILLSICISSYAQKGSLLGKVFDNEDSLKPVIGAIVTIDSLKQTTNELGLFKFDSLSFGIKEIKITSVGFRKKTFETLVKKEATIVIQLFLGLPCKYDNLKDDPHCPKCHKKNKVVKIIYGLPIGNINRSKYYYAGCEITDCDPNWYCKRDKIKF